MEEEMREVQLKIPDELAESAAKLEPEKPLGELLTELAAEGLRARIYRLNILKLRAWEISLTKAAEEMDISLAAVLKVASKEEVLLNLAEQEILDQSRMLAKVAGIVDASILIPLYHAGKLHEFSAGMVKLGVAPAILHSTFLELYKLAKSMGSDDISTPLKAYKIVEISAKEKGQAGALQAAQLANLDKENIYLARREKALILSSDAAVYRACAGEGVGCISMAAALLKMVKEGAVSIQDAAETVYAAQLAGPRLSEASVRFLMQEIERFAK